MLLFHNFLRMVFHFSAAADAIPDSIKRAKQIDICFLVDVTGSMSTYIAGTEKAITAATSPVLVVPTHVAQSMTAARQAQAVAGG